MLAARLAVPRAGFALHSKQLQSLRSLQSWRLASTTAPPPPPKPRVLEKPDKFRPPSHPSRLRTRSPRYVGPALSDAEIERQKTKQYPHMMPPEGSWMYWFLTHRSLHLYITLSVLIGLVGGVWLTDFLYNTPYRDLLPPNSMFISHPFNFIWRWYEVYDMHLAYTSAQVNERRKQKVADVKKRSDYRKAHGLDDGESGIFGGWSAKSDEEVRGPALRDDEPKTIAPGFDGEGTTTPLGETYTDFQGNTQTARKKWFGIW